MSDTSVGPLAKDLAHLVIDGETVALCGYDPADKIELDPQPPTEREQRRDDCAECWGLFREMPDA